MSKLLVVFGVTGQQGGSVASFVVADPELSKQYKVRGVTRNPSSTTAQALQSKGIEIVQGDTDDPTSTKAAIQGAHTIFAMTVTNYGPPTKYTETEQGKHLADAAVAAGADYLIWSSMCNATKESGGKYTKVFSFDNKEVVEAYIRSLPIKSAFFAPGFFMSNFEGQMLPRPVGDGTYTIAGVASPQTVVPLIDTAADSGKFVGAVLAEPEEFEGKFLAPAAELLSYEELAQTISKVTGKTVKYNQIPEEVFRGFFPSQAMADSLTEMNLYFQHFGYYGANTKKLVEWTVQQAHGKPTTFEEYLRNNPLKLD